MSHEKVRSIKIDEKQQKVFINCASNNCRPLSYSREEFPSFSRILKEEGKEAVEIALLKTYEEGSLQDGKNKFTRALKVLFYVFGEEYKIFDWRINNSKYGSEEDKKHREGRESEEFKQLLLKALNYKIGKKQYIITKIYCGEKVFGKRCPTCMKWSSDKTKATKYDFEEEAKDNIYKEFKDSWNIEEIGGSKVKLDLSGFNGTQQYHNVMGVNATDGVNYLMGNGLSWFITDSIVNLRNIENLKKQPFITIDLKVFEDKTCCVEFSDGNNNILYKQDYKYTDADQNIKLFFTDNVLMLSGEY